MARFFFPLKKVDIAIGGISFHPRVLAELGLG